MLAGLRLQFEHGGPIMRLINRSAFAACFLAWAVASQPVHAAQSTKPDNTRMNQGDRDGVRPTAGDQKGYRSDMEVTRQIRRSIVQDKQLSTYAHNVKVITK